MILVFLFVIISLFCGFGFSSFIVTFDNAIDMNITMKFEFNSPPFALGNLTFPFTGTGVVVDACDGFDKLDKEPYKSLPKIIALTKRVDSTCSIEQNIFRCGEKSNCVGVIFEEISRVKAGLSMWSIFDMHRSKSEFHVPLVSVTTNDFSKLTDMALNNHSITITEDPNPWQEMFQSNAFLIVFRVIFPLWQFICFCLSGTLLYKVLNQQGRRPKNTSSSKYSCRGKLTLARACLGIETLCNLERCVFLAVDPFYSQQIFSYVPANVLLTISVSGKVVTNILLCFFLRELTSANYSFHFLSRLQTPCYVVVSILVVGDLAQSVFTGLFLKFSAVSVWGIKAGFFLVINILIGSWLLYERYRFIKVNDARAKATNGPNSHRRSTFVRLLVHSANAIILLGLLLILVLLTPVFGTPWGYFSTWLLLTGVLSFCSNIQIFMFSSVSLLSPESKQRLKSRWQALTSTTRRLSAETNTNQIHIQEGVSYTAN